MVQKKTGLGLRQDRIFQVKPDLDKSDIDSVVNYLNSGGWLTEHKITESFEKEIKDYVDRKSAFSVPNGTIAIYLSILASGIKKGSRVAVPNLTMIATINAVLWAESIPVLVDVDETLCMSYEKLTEVNDLDAVIFVPLNGRTGEGEKIEQWCEKNNILLIEDSAHALSSSYSNKKCGSLGDLSIFSFTPHKIITMGQGGMILTNNKEYAENIFNLKTFNRSKDKLDWHDGFGLNFKITDIQASLGLSQFKKLDKFSKGKKRKWEIYKEEINTEKIEFIPFNDKEVPWFFDIVCMNKKHKENIQNSLEKMNIETRNCYPPLSLQKYLKNIEKTNLDYSENISENILWLPSSNNLEEIDIKEISKIISSQV